MTDETLARINLMFKDTAANADYWLNGGRNEPDRAEAVMAVEQSTNAWRNAAYHVAELLEKQKETVVTIQKREIVLEGLVRRCSVMLPSPVLSGRENDKLAEDIERALSGG